MRTFLLLLLSIDFTCCCFAQNINIIETDSLDFDLFPPHTIIKGYDSKPQIVIDSVFMEQLDSILFTECFKRAQFDYSNEPFTTLNLHVIFKNTPEKDTIKFYVSLAKSNKVHRSTKYSIGFVNFNKVTYWIEASDEIAEIINCQQVTDAQKFEWYDDTSWHVELHAFDFIYYTNVKQLKLAR